MSKKKKTSYQIYVQISGIILALFFIILGFVNSVIISTMFEQLTDLQKFLLLGSEYIFVFFGCSLLVIFID